MVGEPNEIDKFIDIIKQSNIPPDKQEDLIAFLEAMKEILGG